jgi:ubiquinone/menaquinone biosynthesis C-methylase UbiE
MKRDFDKEAKLWDTNPYRLQMTTSIANAMHQSLNLNQNQILLDFGAGTGLVTLKLQSEVKKVYAVDSSPGMLSVLNEKLDSAGITNVEPILWDIEQEPWSREKVDIIVSSMTMHHIKDTRKLITAFFAILNPIGQMAIADLDSDNGEFHDDPTGVEHNGFDREELKRLVFEIGFNQVKIDTGYTIRKPIKSGKERDFTVFILTAIK